MFLLLYYLFSLLNLMFVGYGGAHTYIILVLNNLMLFNMMLGVAHTYIIFYAKYYVLFIDDCTQIT